MCGKVTGAPVLCRPRAFNPAISFFVSAGTRLALSRFVLCRLTIAVLVAGLAWSRVVGAEENERLAWTGERPLAIEFGNGVRSPLGWLYAAVDVSPFRYLSLAAGMGYGEHSMQVSAMARLRIPAGRTSVGAIVHGLGIGWSMGRLTTPLPEPCQPTGFFDEECASPGDKVWNRAERINVEYSIELPLVASVLALRMFTGGSMVANSGGDYDCDTGAAPVPRCQGNYADLGKYFLYAGIGFSFLLDPWSSTPQGFPSDEEPP